MKCACCGFMGFIAGSCEALAVLQCKVICLMSLCDAYELYVVDVMLLVFVGVCWCFDVKDTQHTLCGKSK